MRALAKQSKESPADADRARAADEFRALLAASPTETATSLVRAFSSYFYLANIAEQVNRVRSLRDPARARRPGWPATVSDVTARRSARARWSRPSSPWTCGPVFTAHPTEASRRSILSKLRGIATSWPCPHARISRPAARQDRELAELVDLIWQTDELRGHRPTPVDEARNALYYLTDIVTQTLPGLMTDLAVEVARGTRPCCPPTAVHWRSARGSAATATETRTSPPP